MKSTHSSSTFYIPGSYEDVLRDRWKSRQASRDRNEAFATLLRYVRERGGWLVSNPGDAMVRMEVLPNSELPFDLRRLGYRVDLDKPPSGERIVANDTVEAIVTEGSTTIAFETVHAGIRRVMRYVFP